MPELPEVETVKETLKSKIIGKTIINVNVIYNKTIENISSTDFKKKLINQKIVDIKRRGKWLLFEFDNFYLLSHLRMEGKYYIRNTEEEIDKHEHVIFNLDDNTDLRYNDTRKFGRMQIISKDDAYNIAPLSELGLEPFDKKLNVEYLKEKYKKVSLPIKTSLLDQTIITGIGNIYADEILFLSNINPYRKANSLNEDEIANIIKYTKKVLTVAIKNGGTTIRTFESSRGVHGNYQEFLLVHGKDKEECPICHHRIIKETINGRGTYYCKVCQK